MANDADDLERYRRDEMSPAERHTFERRALEDPFLRDALSGSESLTPEAFSKDVHDLRGRFAQSRRQWFTPIRIAAGIAVVVTAGWLVFRNTPAAPESLAELKNDSTALSDSTSRLLTLAAPSKDSTGETDKKDAEKSIAKIPAVKPAETQPTSSQPSPASTTDPATSGTAAKTEPVMTEPVKTEPAKADAPKTEIARTEVAEDARRDEESPAKEAASSTLQKKAAVARPQVAPGTSREAEQGVPLPRAHVSAAQDAMVADDVTKKSEVIMYVEDSTSSTPGTLASPAGGLEAYRRYLEENQRVPDAARAARVHGKVTVAFEVPASGGVSGLRVLKSLGHGCDEELIRLIRGGPTWSPMLRGGKTLASTVWVKLEFAADR